MTTSRIGDDGVCTVWQDGDIATRFHRTSQGWRNTGVRDWRRARPWCSYLKDPARFCTLWLNFQKKFKQCTNISFGNLLVVQIYVVHLLSAVGVCTVCVWFFLPFVCLITLFVGAKTKRFTFRLHFVDLLKIMQCISSINSAHSYSFRVDAATVPVSQMVICVLSDRWQFNAKQTRWRLFSKNRY